MPDKITISLSSNLAAVRGLEKLLLRAADAYTNTGNFLKIDLSKWPNATRLLFDNNVKLNVSSSGLTTINDKLFDLMEGVLAKESPNSDVLHTVGAPVRSAPQKKAGVPKAGRPAKVTLKHYMGSLDKIKPVDADAWLDKNPGPYVLSSKLDGVSIQLNYRKGRPPQAFTRGDGKIGQDISRLVPHLKIPQKLDRDLDVRGEIIMTESAFNLRWASKFENARNLASGLVNRIEAHPAIHDIDVVVYEILSPRGVPSKQLTALQGMGFHVVQHTVQTKITAAQLSTVLIARKLQSKHAIDGLVLVQDKTSELAGDSNPKHAVAFKETADSDIAVVRVKEVVWESSKNNLLKPRVNIEPVRLSGVTINFATGHNAFFIKNGFRTKDRNKGLPVRPLGPGALVRITRSGDVIPHIIEVVKGVKVPQMPEEAFVWNKTGADIIQSVASTLSDKKRVTYFFSKLDVEGLRMGTVSKFFDAGLDTILRIVRAPEARFLKIDGIQERTAHKLRTNIDKALSTMTLPALMDASGFFGALGEKRLTLIVKKHPDILEHDEHSHGQLLPLIVDIPGFKSTLGTQFIAGLPKFKRFYARLGVVAPVPKAIRIVAGGPLKGQTFVFTGFRDSALELTILTLGGEIGSTVNSKTTMLCVKDAAAESSKIQRARSLGIKVISGDALRKRLTPLRLSKII